MSVNKKQLMEAFQTKDYLACITSLREEIKKILIQKLQEQKPDYSYTSIAQLKEYVFRYLDENEKRAILILYRHSYEEMSEEFELDDLLDIYKSLK